MVFDKRERKETLVLPHTLVFFTPPAVIAKMDRQVIKFLEGHNFVPKETLSLQLDEQVAVRYCEFKGLQINEVTIELLTLAPASIVIYEGNTIHRIANLIRHYFKGVIEATSDEESFLETYRVLFGKEFLERMD